MKIPFQKTAMTLESSELFNLPQTAQDGDNLYSMVNWAPIYVPLLDSLRPNRIVEIGSENGDNTMVLGQYCISNSIELHVVDTYPIINNELAKSKLINYHNCRSIDFIKNFQGAEVYFIDGDHNYHTLSEELKLIEEADSNKMPLLLLIHDTGWPNGSRDSFYDLNTIEGEIPEHCDKNGPLPWKNYLDKRGFGAGLVSFALKEGGKNNGLRAAIKEFISLRKEWKYSFFSPFYGLCFLCKNYKLSLPFSKYFTKIIDAMETVEPIFATLEWNRLLLYIKTQSDGIEWKYQQDIIRELLKENQQAGEIWQEQQKWIAHLEERCRSSKIRF